MQMFDEPKAAAVREPKRAIQNSDIALPVPEVHSRTYNCKAEHTWQMQVYWLDVNHPTHMLISCQTGQPNVTSCLTQ